jgi:23S rRNA pseudouridine1911/1915/1917 synthase
MSRLGGLEWTIEAGAEGVRLDVFLSGQSRLGSRARAASALERGKVFVNGAEASARDRARLLAAGDRVRLWMDRPGTSKRPARVAGDARGALPIIYEDDVLIVVNKPAGLLTVPLARRDRARSAKEQLAEFLERRGKRQPLVVHRIDRDTSGLIVFATRGDALTHLKEQFRRRAPVRVYLAVVYGHPSPEEGVWRDRLVWDQAALVQKRTHPRDPRGKEARCRYRVVERFETASLIEVHLETGKRNQIRLQARLRGHTLVGEQRYVFGPEQLRPIAFPRQALHAWRLGFDHPIDGRPLSFEAPLPDDMKRLLRRLRRSESFR